MSGEYVLGVATYNIKIRDHNDLEGATQLGLVPLARLLNRVAARTIGLEPKCGATRPDLFFMRRTKRTLH